MVGQMHPLVYVEKVCIDSNLAALKLLYHTMLLFFDFFIALCI